MAQIETLKIQGFKSIDSLLIDLTPINVLIGPNGAGKSNFIAVFKLLSKIVAGDLQAHVADIGHANRVLHFGSRQTQTLRIELDFPPNRYTMVLVPTSDDRLVVKFEACYFTGYEVVNKPVLLAPPGALESGLGLAVGPIPAFTRDHIRDWRVFHFHDTGNRSPIKTSSKVTDFWKLDDNAGNLAAFLHWRREHEVDTYRRILETVQIVAPFIQDFVFNVSGDGDRFVRLGWKHQGSDSYFDVADLSDGTLRFICLAALLLQKDLPSVVLIDEPELGLHPHAIRILAEMLRNASARAQIVVSTQSVPLVDQFAPEEIVAVGRKDGASCFRRLDSAKLAAWLETYSLGELLEKNVLDIGT